MHEKVVKKVAEKVVKEVAKNTRKTKEKSVNLDSMHQHAPYEERQAGKIAA